MKGWIDPRFLRKDSWDKKIENEILSEMSSSLGRIGKIIEDGVKKQKDILSLLRKKIFLNEDYEMDIEDIENLSIKEQNTIKQWVKDYQKYYHLACEYQYYLNVQKEALKLRKFDTDPYGILPNIKIKSK